MNLFNIFKSFTQQFKIATLLLFLSLISYNSLQANEANTKKSFSKNETKIEEINQAIHKKLLYYNENYPDIQFVHLKNGEWEKSIQALELFIGYQATNLDYEHPKDLREDLLFATVAKIQMMLVNKIASSYLFKAGQIPAASKQHICVITLDPATSVLNNQVATQHFTDISLNTLKSLPKKSYLDKDHHLDFIIDHEAFHCLDTFQYGGIPMSEKQFSTRYDCFKREIQADMFAIAMHVRRNKKLTHYANNIILLRAMTLLNGELQHDSSKAMQLMLESDKDKFIHTQPKELVTKVKKLYSTVALDYDQYLKHRVAAVEVIRILGKEVNEYEKPFSPAGHKSDKEIIQRLMKQSLDSYHKYTGAPYVLP